MAIFKNTSRDINNVLFEILMESLAEPDGQRFIELNDLLKKNSRYKVPQDADKRCLKVIEGAFAEQGEDDFSTAENILFEIKPKRKIFIATRAAAVIAAVISLATIASYAAGYDIWASIATWTEETFVFRNNAPVESPLLTSPSSELHSLEQALEEYGITEKLVPSYIPEGYEISDFLVNDINSCIALYEYLENEDGNVIKVSIVIYNNIVSRPHYSKDIGNPEKYISGDITHYIMSNTGEYLATWENGLYEGNISGLKEETELKKMIDSIYEG